MRVLFAGSPEIAVPALKALCAIEGIELAGVLTNPDTPKGRHGAPQPTDVGEAAVALYAGTQSASCGEASRAIPILKPEKLDAFAREQVGALKCDLLISFAYGRIFGPMFMALFPLGGINIHPSLLPKYRGPTPVQAAILNRDKVTGITVQWLAKEMDCGDIIIQEELPLSGKETADSLSVVIAAKAAVMLPEALKKIATGNARGIPQSEIKTSAGYCSLISKEDGQIDWGRSTEEIEAKIRAFTPWPLCRTIHDGRELIILKADVFNDDETAVLAKLAGKPGQVLGSDKNYGILIRTGKGILAVTQLQYQAKKALFWRDFLNGARDFSGSILG